MCCLFHFVIFKRKIKYFANYLYFFWHANRIIMFSTQINSKHLTMFVVFRIISDRKNIFNCGFLEMQYCKYSEKNDEIKIKLELKTHANVGIQKQNN